MNKKKLKVIIILFIIILLIAGYFTLLQKPQTAAADWFDDSWLYRQTINITNSGTNQTDFQVMITLDSATLITANKVQSDCDDIRITDINGKLIPHWIEPTTCNTSATKIWTKVPSISTSGDTVYLYYGNSAVSSVSSSTDTFIREISGVQGAWDMDGTVGGISTGDTLADSSGNTNTGTASNVNTTGMAYATGKVEQGVDFDGVDDYVSIADDDNLELNNQYTVSFWVYPESLSDAVVVGRLNGTSKGINTSWAVYFDEYISTPRFFFMAGDGSSYDWWYNIYTPSINNWYHFVITADGTNYRAYVNGIYKGSKAQNITQTRQTSSNFHVGLDQYANTFFNGSVDNLRIYDQTLSQAEISDLYGTGGDRQGYVTTNYPNKSLVRKYSALVSIDPPIGEERGPGPVAYWKFDEGFGQTANDSTINANNGTLGATSGSESSDPTWQTEDMCVTGKCLKFDGVDDYVRTTNSASLSEFSVNVWIKTTVSGGVLAEYCDGTTLCTPTSNYDRIIYMNDSGNIIFSIYIGGYGMTSITSANSYSDGTFHYISAVIGTDGMKLYVDSVLVASNALSSAASSSYKWYIGSGSTSGYPDRPTNDKFNGFIDDVKIYPYARTAAQIKADYSSRGTASGVSASLGSQTSNSRGRTSLSDGLVGYWKMDEASWNGTADEVVDSSGSGNDGVRIADATTAVGKFGNGGTFDGTGDYVNAGNNSSLDITDEITIGAWIYADNSTSYMAIADRIYAGSTGSWSLYTQSGGIVFATATASSRIRTTASFTYGNSAWHHIIATFSLAEQKQKIYIDGVLRIEDDRSTVLQNPTQNLFIGYGPVSTGYFNGFIDEVRIYNRALSPGEVRDLYNWAPGPVAHWKMDEKVSGNGQTINDSSGYGNTGTTSSANGTGMDCMVPGKYGSGCEFDGVDDYVDFLAHGSDTEFNSSTGTVSMWVKSQGVDYNPLITIRNTGNSYLLIREYTNRLWILSNGSSPFSLFTSTGSVSRNEWYDLSVTQTGTEISVYINGIEQVLTGTNSGYWFDDIFPFNSMFNIGGVGIWTEYFNGSIDDVRIYNYARTQAQIMEDYAGGAGRKKQPIAHWKFDEGYGTTANNSGIGGSSLNGTLTNMASPATSASGWTDEGKMGKGLVFDGSNDNVIMDNIQDISGTQSITISSWMKTSVPPSGLDIHIASFTEEQDSINADKGFRMVNANSGKVSFWVYDGATQSALSNSILTDDTWYYLTGVYDGINVYLYVDGIQQISTDTANSSYNFTTPQFQIASLRGSDARFNGSIDDVKIYNYALTEDEVREEYNQGALLKLGSTGTDSSGNPDDSASREYCIPGDTSTCNPPVGRWDFNEGTGTTVNDISGNNNTGTWNGTGSHWTQGKIGKGGIFNGSNDYVNIGNMLDGTTDGTIETWVKPTTFVNLATIWGEASVSDSYLNLQGTSGIIRFKLGAITYLDTVSNLSLNNWNHVATTYGASGMKIYINGVLNSSNTTTGTVDTHAGYVFKIGAIDYYGRYFNGFIDQVRIYDYARTPAQIAWDYNRGKPIAHWKFDECQGSIANDASGNGNNGTITIGATGTQDGIGTCTDGDSSNAWYNGRTGKYNSAMSFDGSDDYVEISDSSNLDFEDFSVETWVKTSTDIGGIVQSYNYSESSGKNWGLRYSGGWYGQIRLTDGNTQSEVSFGNIADGTWKHLVFVRNGTVLSAYVDGVLFTNVTDAVSGSIDIGKEVYIGRHRYITTSEYFNGLIDEVKIYNYALTAEQVKTEYNQGAVNFR